MNILNHREINGDLILVVDEVPELGLVIKIGGVEYKVTDIDRFKSDVHHMIVVERAS